MGDRRMGCSPAVAAALIAMICSAASATDFQLTRWAEDYRAYADPALRTTPQDAIKYIPLGGTPGRYLSLGGHARIKAVALDAPLFGLGAADADGHWFQRVHLHADVHHGPRLRAFVELSDARVHGKDRIFPIDSNRIELQQAFVDMAGTIAGGDVVLRGGRQELQFDATQRFVALREAPNVRRSLDGMRLTWSMPSARLDAFHTRVVEPRDDTAFDDRSVDGIEFSGLRARHDRGDLRFDGYAYRYARDTARFADELAREQRLVVGAQSIGRSGAFDWDVEAAYQTGNFGRADIRAWALGSMLGYTLIETRWRPRLGLQFDAASGDRRADDDRLQTFNPLFPKGSYFTSAGLTDFANLLHTQVSLRVQPWRAAALGVGSGHLARQSRADAAYAQPFLPIPRSVTGSTAIGEYLRLEARQRLNRYVTVAAELVRYWPAENLRQVGAKRADHAELFIRFQF